MKKLLYTLLAVSLIYSACEKEEEETSNTGNNNNGSNNTLPSLIGTWEMTNDSGTETWGYLDPIQGTEVVVLTDNWNDNYPFEGYTAFYSFESDGVFTTSDYINGSLDHYHADSYLFEGNNLTLWMDGGGSTYQVTTLTNSTLILSHNYYSSTDNGDTITFWRNTGSETFNKYN